MLQISSDRAKARRGWQSGRTVVGSIVVDASSSERQGQLIHLVLVAAASTGGVQLAQGDDG